MADLRTDMLEEVKLDEAQQILQNRQLGFSQVRLLPKGGKLRPIMNLRRRAMTRGPSRNLGRSINTVLGPIHSLLKLEKVRSSEVAEKLKLTSGSENQPFKTRLYHVLRQ